MRMNKRSASFIVGVIMLCLSLFLRLFDLGNTPHGFHQDEVANAYVGRYIIENGVDLYGNPYPLLHFDKHGDYPPVIPMYLSAAGTYIFGLNPLGTRILIAFIGALIVIPLYHIAFMVFKSRRSAFFVMFLGAASPWLVSFARVGTENTLATTVYLFGLWGLFAWLKKEHLFLFLVSTFALLSTYLLYPGYRIIVPLTFIVFAGYMIWATRDAPDKKPARTLFIFASVLSIVLSAAILRTPWGMGRAIQTSILTSAAGLPPQRILTLFMEQYLSYLNPLFLFIKGGLPDWFAIPNTGLIYISTLVPLFFIFIPLDKKIKLYTPLYIILLALTLIALIPAALTTELTPHTHRSLLFGVLLLFIVGYGWQRMMHLHRGFYRALKVLVVVGVFLEMVMFVHTYFQDVNATSAIARSDANPQAARYLLQNQNKYSQVYMMATGWFPAYYLFEKQDFGREYAGTFRRNFRLDKIGNIHFVDSDCPPTNFEIPPLITDQKPILIVMTSACKNIPPTYQHAANIKAINGMDVYRAYTYNVIE